jgi:hypothetical protein
LPRIREKKKTGGGPVENDLDKFANAITEMLPQKISGYPLPSINIP